MLENNQSANTDQIITETPDGDKISASNIIKDYLLLIISAGLIILADQWTKSLVLDNIPFTHTWLPDSLSWLSPYARIVHWRNSGAAFGMFQQGSLIFTILSIIAIIFIIYYFPRIEKKEWPLRLAMILQLSGAAGNLIDRLRYGYVIDYISVGNFPVFNIADASISVGVAVLLIGVVVQDYKAKQRTISDQQYIPKDMEE